MFVQTTPTTAMSARPLAFIEIKHEIAVFGNLTMHLRLISSPPVPKYGLEVTPAAALNSREVKAIVAGSVNRS